MVNGVQQDLNQQTNGNIQLGPDLHNIPQDENRKLILIFISGYKIKIVQSNLWTFS